MRFNADKTLVDQLNDVRRWYQEASRAKEAAVAFFDDLDYERRQRLADMPRGTTIDDGLLKYAAQGIEQAAWVERYRTARRAKDAATAELDRADHDSKAVREIIGRTTAEIYQIVESLRNERAHSTNR